MEEEKNLENTDQEMDQGTPTTPEDGENNAQSEDTPVEEVAQPKEESEIPAEEAGEEKKEERDPKSGARVLHSNE